MRSATQIKDSIFELREELDAIVAVTEREERDLNEEEAKRTSEISETLIPALNKQLKTALSIEKERNNRLQSRVEEQIQQTQAETGVINANLNADRNANRFAALRIPAKALVHGPLKAYQGPDAARDAYVAGNVILASLFGNESSMQFCRNHGLVVNASMTTGTNTAGGFLVPDEMQRTIIRLREERGVFPQFANKMPMGSDIITIPRLLSDVTAYWTAEAAEITASDPTIGQAELMARKLSALTKVSSELDEDAVVDIGDMITASMAYAMADKIDLAAFLGDGTATYGGVTGLASALDANAIIGAASTHTGAATLTMADFETVVGSYPQYTGASPRWYFNSATYWATAARLVDAAGGNTNVTLADGPSQQRFLGYPVTFAQVMTAVTGTSASAIIAYFGDLRLAATYGTRRSVRTQISTERYFELDIIGIKTTERVAILIHEVGDTIRTRPILCLKAAAS